MELIDKAYALVEAGNITEDTLDAIEEMMDAAPESDEIYFSMLLEGVNLTLRMQENQNGN